MHEPRFSTMSQLPFWILPCINKNGQVSLHSLGSSWTSCILWGIMRSYNKPWITIDHLEWCGPRLTTRTCINTQDHQVFAGPTGQHWASGGTALLWSVTTKNGACTRLFLLGLYRARCILPWKILNCDLVQVGVANLHNIFMNCDCQLSYVTSPRKSTMLLDPTILLNSTRDKKH